MCYSIYRQVNNAKNKQMTHTTFQTMTDSEIRTANENARMLRSQAISNSDKITEKIASQLIEINIKELNRRFHAEQALLEGIDQACESIMMDEIFA